MKQASYLSAQLRESAPYLRDSGWRETATLLTLAADEIEQLRSCVVGLKNTTPPEAGTYMAATRRPAQT